MATTGRPGMERTDKGSAPQPSRVGRCRSDRLLWQLLNTLAWTLLPFMVAIGILHLVLRSLRRSPVLPTHLGQETHWDASPPVQRFPSN